MAALIISCALSAMLLINKKIGHRGVCHRSTNSIMMQVTADYYRVCFANTRSIYSRFNGFKGGRLMETVMRSNERVLLL